MQPNESGSNRTPTATKIATTQYEVVPPDLAAVVAAWPDLPEAIRTGILAMVNAALPKGGVR
jgi:hypothetical protein